MVTIDSPERDEADLITSLWIELAESQRQHGSHLLSEANRATIQDDVARHIVTGGLFVARPESTGEIIGFVMFSPDSGIHEQDVKRGVIHNLYVRESYQGNGVGSALLDAAEGALGDAGIETIAIEAMAANEAAQRLYRRRGYELHRVELEKHIETPNHISDNQ